MPGVTPLRSQLLSEQGFRHGFSLRTGGVSEGPYASCNLGRGVGDDLERVAENHRRFSEAVGYAPAGLFELSQVHGREVRVVKPGDSPAELRAESGDGLVARGGAAIGVRTADCVPVLLADPGTRSVAALHAGWRGTALGVVSRGVEQLAAASGAPASRLIAAIFPHIAVCCFEVSEDVAEQLRAACPQLKAARERGPDGTLQLAAVSESMAAALAPAATFVERPGARPHVSLAGIILRQLMAAGVSLANVDLVAGCTMCEPERFFSYRRDGQVSGRHLTAIVAG